MRVSRDQVMENKRAILAAAGRLFRERGFESVTVAEIMKSAGLTHGGFYGYFNSKDDLIAQALADVLESTAGLPTELMALADRYLSTAHRDNSAIGCLFPALSSETIHQSGAVRAAMTAGLKQRIGYLSGIATGPDKPRRRRAAIGTWAAMVGAVILARMTNDSELSDEILNETRAWLAAQNRKKTKTRRG
jgi:TetR/AcrR family transcriptional regulator, transcriptional repressor for nem operon